MKDEMIKHTEEFLRKQSEMRKEREIQRQLKEEEKKMKREATRQRKLRKKRIEYEEMKNDPERYQVYLDYMKEYGSKKREENHRKVSQRMKESGFIEYQGYYVNENGEVYNKAGRRIKGYKYKNGYHTTFFNGKYILTHRLVWEAFFGEIPEGYEIDHINTIRDDNRLSNLRITSHKANCNNPASLKNYSRGNTTGHCKPIIETKPDGTEIEWIGSSECARQNPTYHQTAISACCRGKLNTHKGSKFRFKEKTEHLP